MFLATRDALVINGSYPGFFTSSNVGCTRFCVVLLESDGVSLWFNKFLTTPAKLGEQRFSYMTFFRKHSIPCSKPTWQWNIPWNASQNIVHVRHLGLPECREKKTKEKRSSPFLNCCSSVLNHHISTKPSIGFFRFRPANLNKTLGLNLVSAGTRVPTLQGMDITDSKSCFCKGCFGSPPPQNLGSRSPQADLPKKKVL